MPYIKTRPVLSPVFNDDYDIFEITTDDNDFVGFTDTNAISGSRYIYKYDNIFSTTVGNPILAEDKLSDQYVFGSFYFGRLTFNTNKYIRQFAEFVTPDVAFSTKYSLENFNKNIQSIRTEDFLYKGSEVRIMIPDPFILTSYYYYGWNFSDSLDVSNNYIINYRAAYAGLTQNIPAPTQSFFFTSRPLESDLSEINMIPAVIYLGNTQSIFHVSEYSSTGQSLTYSFFTMSNSSAFLNTQYLKFKRPSSNVDYVEVWMGPTAVNMSIARNNRRTKIYKLNNNCKNINNLEMKTIVFQNKFGTFDSYDFSKINDVIKTSKENYDSSMNIEINRSIPLYLGGPGIYTKSRQTFQRQNKINNLKAEELITIATKNIDKITIEWLKDLISSENVYEYNNGELKPIIIEQNSIIVKPINNIYSQLVISYNYSQKQRTR